MSDRIQRYRNVRFTSDVQRFQRNITQISQFQNKESAEFIVLENEKWGWEMSRKG